VIDKRIRNYQKCQIFTPPDVISFYWKLLKIHRPTINRVLDLGAGDGRFALGGYYHQYDGVEINKKHERIANLPSNANLFYKCVFNFEQSNYDGCVGNPPYVRHHEIDAKWRRRIIKKIKNELNITLNEQCNLFVYFMCLGLIKTAPDGFLAFIIPYEWASRPSVIPLHELIKKNKWGVHVYKFRERIFSKVLTTASITIIDKKEITNKWKYYEIDSEFRIKNKKGLSEASATVLPYEGRGKIWALRGLSPGTQKVFTLTEGERIHFGLQLNDVEPCITSLRCIPGHFSCLTYAIFKKYVIDAGEKCWIIKSYLPEEAISDSLRLYINSIAPEQRNTSTCIVRDPWYRYVPHPIPIILYSSGFTSRGPKIMLNNIGAKTIGSVQGIHSSRNVNKIKLMKYLKSINYEKNIVAHSNSLKKIEVNQMNGILNKFSK
jgi:tRNA1(Val) A37 N6-methylase TrmN6